MTKAAPSTTTSLTITASLPDLDFDGIEYLRLKFPSGKVLVLNRCHLCRGFFMATDTCFVGDKDGSTVLMCQGCEEKTKEPANERRIAEGD